MDKFNPKRIRHLRTANRVLRLFFHEKKADRPLDIASAGQILVIDPTLIGDIVMLVPFLRALKRTVPGARITLVCGPWAVAVLDGQGLIDRFVIVNPKVLNSPKRMLAEAGRMRKVLKEVNRTRYDIALEPKGDLRYIFFMHFCNAECKVSYNYTGGECLLTDVIKPSEEAGHLVEDKMFFARSLGCRFTEEDMYPVLNLTESQRKKNMEYIRMHDLERKTVIGVHPGASQEHKRWKRFSELVGILDIPGAVFLIFSGPGEKGIAEEVVRAGRASGRECIHVHEKLEDYVRLLSVCHVCVCNDSGCGHLAAAYGRAVVVVFGPFEAEFAEPYSRKTYAVSQKLKCKPCMSDVCLTGTNECIDSISVAEVTETVRKALAEVGI